MIKGQWSKVSMALALQHVLGKERFQELEVKTQSIYSSKGEFCMLDEVYFLPWRGISVKPKVLIRLSKMNISDISALGMFLFSCICIG